MKFNHIKSDQFMGYFDLGLAAFSALNTGFFAVELLHLCGKPVIIPRFNGGPHWSPRNSQPRTPPGPEGSNGSGYAVCRGVAGEGHRHISPFDLSLFVLFALADNLCRPLKPIETLAIDSRIAAISSAHKTRFAQTVVRSL